MIKLSSNLFVTHVDSIELKLKTHVLGWLEYKAGQKKHWYSRHKEPENLYKLLGDNNLYTAEQLRAKNIAVENGELYALNPRIYVQVVNKEFTLFFNTVQEARDQFKSLKDAINIH